MGRKNLSLTRRLEIIKSFYTVAKTHGLENASIAKVADEMGISNGLVMHYFNTKDELLIGLNEYILEQHVQVFKANNSDDITTKEELESLIKNLFSRKWNQYFDDGVFYSCYALIYRNDAFNKSFKAYLLSLHEVLQLKLEQAKDHKVIYNTNLNELTEIIFALVDGSYYYMGMFNPDDPSHEQQELIYVQHCLGLFQYNEKF